MIICVLFFIHRVAPHSCTSFLRHASFSSSVASALAFDRHGCNIFLADRKARIPAMVYRSSSRLPVRADATVFRARHVFAVALPSYAGGRPAACRHCYDIFLPVPYTSLNLLSMVCHNQDKLAVQNLFVKSYLSITTDTILLDQAVLE
jgi:hypothetical protein